MRTGLTRPRCIPRTLILRALMVKAASVARAPLVLVGAKWARRVSVADRALNLAEEDFMAWAVWVTAMAATETAMGRTALSK